MSRKRSSDLERILVETRSPSSCELGDHDKKTVEILGDEQVRDTYGHVNRGLKARHVQFIGLGGSIGTSLFLAVGRVLAVGGPLSMLLGFIISGVAVFGMMQCLGEMTTWLPLSGAMPHFATRYVDNALGFAVGWNGWYTYAIGICIEISAGAVIIGYWDSTTNVGIWITIMLVTIILLNIFAVSIYGEAEFWFASLKIITIVGLLFLSLVLDLGGGPDHDRKGFTYWKNPGAMKTFVGHGDTGRFTGLFFCIVMACYTYGGVESVVVTAGEAQDPRKNLPKAIRRVFWRILFFYVLGSLAVGVLVPYNDIGLLTALATNAPGAAGSPWVIAIKRAGIKGLPSIINAVILTSACSAANACLYNGSRFLTSMAQNGLAPKIFMRCSKKGVPYYSIALTASLSTVAYLSCAAGPDKVFVWLANFATVMVLLAWISICVVYLRFYAALREQGVNRNDLVFKSVLQPYLAWGCIAFFSVVTFFSGFYGFSPWSVQTFISSYIGIPIYLSSFIFWKVVKRTKFVRPAEADLWTGKAAIDAEVWPATEPRNFVEKVWMWVI